MKSSVFKVAWLLAGSQWVGSYREATISMQQLLPLDCSRIPPHPHSYFNSRGAEAPKLKCWFIYLMPLHDSTQTMGQLMTYVFPGSAESIFKRMNTMVHVVREGDRLITLIGFISIGMYTCRPPETTFH